MTQSSWSFASAAPQKGCTALVTGANSGLGFATAQALAGAGVRVLLACRDQAKGEHAVQAIVRANRGAQVETVHLDLADLESVATCALALQHRLERLDLLVNNAGVMVPPLGHTQQGFELQFGTNHLGHFALTGQLLSLLAKTPGSRVVTVASAGANFFGFTQRDLEDPGFERRPYRAWVAYGQSKLANLLFCFELARRIERAGLTMRSTAAHPGGANTNLQRTAWYLRWFVNPWVMSAERAAATTLRAALDPNAANGSYWGPDAPLEMWGNPGLAYVPKRARDVALARSLWETSERLTGVRFAINTNAP